MIELFYRTDGLFRITLCLLKKNFIGCASLKQAFCSTDHIKIDILFTM